jgi:ferric-dicitrate binding protein FerR (iron transport regulator)
VQDDEEERRASDAWKDADTAAREAETRLRTAWQAYEAGTSGPPLSELIQEVGRLRSRANDAMNLLLFHRARRGRR